MAGRNRLNRKNPALGVPSRMAKWHARSIGASAVALLVLLAFSVPAQANTPTSFAYVTNAAGENPSGGTVSVIDTSTDAVADTIPVGGGPTSIAITSDGAFAYVISDFSPDQVSVVSTATNSVVATVSIEGSAIGGVAVSPDGTRVYVTAQLASPSPAVFVIDTASNTVIDTIPVGPCPVGVAASPDGAAVYVANACSNAISVIDTATNEVVDTVPVGEEPLEVTAAPDGEFVYVSSTADNNVSVIDTATNEVVGTVPVGKWPWGVAITPDSSTAYISDTGDNNVSVIDTATSEVVDTVPVGEEPAGAAVRPDGARVYVANQESNSVSVIDTATNEVVDTVPVGFQPIGIAVSVPIEGSPEPPEEESSGDDETPPPAPSPIATPLVAPSPSTQAGVAVAARSAVARHGRVLLRVRCAGQGPCHGVAKLFARLKPRRHVKRHRRHRASRRTRNVFVGKSRFAVPAGHSAVVRIRLNRRGKTLLRKAGRRSLRVWVVGVGIKNRVLRLNQPQS